jgi:hypothetical protein
VGYVSEGGGSVAARSLAGFLRSLFSPKRLVVPSVVSMGGFASKA